MALVVVMYHYVRDLPHTPFPRLKGLLPAEFESQIKLLQDRYEMASLESALAFLDGAYISQQDLCLLTFDDGLRDHYETVLPILVKYNLTGVFFTITACQEFGRVVSTHKNQFLMAGLGFEEYRQSFLKYLCTSEAALVPEVDQTAAQRIYRWDSPDVAAFKYLVNHVLPGELKTRVLGQLFAERLGDEVEFAHQLYLSWDEAREMQTMGMVFGGHTHEHITLAKVSDNRQTQDLETCASLLRRQLHPQSVWPFSYPYGKPDTFNAHTVAVLKRLGFVCAFSAVPGVNLAGQNLFHLQRMDTKNISVSQERRSH